MTKETATAEATVPASGTSTSLFDDAAGAPPADVQKQLGKFEKAVQSTDAPEFKQDLK